MSEHLKDTGYKLISTSPKDALYNLQALSWSAVILEWQSRRDQQIVRAAKLRDLPVIVVTWHLAVAFMAGEPFADLYLENPAKGQEIAILVIEMIKAGQRAEESASTSAHA